jgi:AAA+ ATPase superfamily predicted ATPase
MGHIARNLGMSTLAVYVLRGMASPVFFTSEELLLGKLLSTFEGFTEFQDSAGFRSVTVSDFL